jgi:hypothetical protein
MKPEFTQIQRSIDECLPHKDPLVRPDYTEAEIQALRAVHRGEADARQQRLLCDFWIRAAGTHDETYRPGDTHATAFAAGKRFVGTTFIWMLRSAPTRTDPDKIAARRSTQSEEQGHA